ncbi:MAG: hypothetical protein JXR70_15975 [Spirochaetales bacterium]|nr:hypothetical protein [Spirochaetales bacterium]
MKKYLYVLLIILTMIFLFSCVSSPPPPQPQSTPQPADTNGSSEVKPGFPPEMQFAGAGQDLSLLTSMQMARADAIKKGVVEIIGAAKERSNSEKLESIIYSAQQQKAFAAIQGKATRKTKNEAGEYIYEANFMVNLAAIESTLKAHGIIGNGPAPKNDVVVKIDDEEGSASIDEGDLEIYDELTTGERKFIKRYIDGMTFLVYFSEEAAGNDPLVVKTAISAANDYLISHKKNAIDLAQVERIKEEQLLVYEEATGESLSLIQVIAQSLNADVYIEIDAQSRAVSKLSGEHLGTASVQAKAFEASTGELVGAANYNLDESRAQFSFDSQEDARRRAVTYVTYDKIMGYIFEQISNNMVEKISTRGIKYDVTIQNPPGDRVMTKYLKKLKSDVRALELLSQSSEELKYEIFIIGDLDSLKEIFYDSTTGIPELEYLEAIMARGKSVTFNSGL